MCNPSTSDVTADGGGVTRNQDAAEMDNMETEFGVAVEFEDEDEEDDDQELDEVMVWVVALIRFARFGLREATRKRRRGKMRRRQKRRERKTPRRWA